MLFVIFELSSDSITIWISSNTLAFTLAVDESTFVVSSIRPGHFTFAMHVVFIKLTLINFSRLREVVFTFSVEFAILEITLINISIKLKFSFSCFLSINKVALVNNLVVIPLFCTFAMILIIFPSTFIHRTLLVNEHSLSTGFSIFPFSLVNISVGVSHSSFAMEKTFLCLTLIFRAIWEFDGSKTSPLLFLFLNGCPLTCIGSSVFNIERSCVPIETFATCFGTQAICKFFILQKDFLSF